MKTADLIAGLAEDAGPVAPASPVRRVGGTTVAGCAIAFAVLLAWLGLRPLAAAVHLPSFWMKAAYTSALGVGAWLLVSRLSRPAASLRLPLFLIVFAVVLMVAMAVMELSGTPARDLKAVWLGHSWRQCPVRIALLAIPIFILVAFAIRWLAPTRLRAAGAAAGLLAGAAAATVYGLACDEVTVAFTATWYSLGIAVCAAIGALLGPRLLRW
jgi:hypothetical protein